VSLSSVRGTTWERSDVVSLQHKVICHLDRDCFWIDSGQHRTVMYITILGFFCKDKYCLNIINFQVTEANIHSPLPGQQIPLRSIRVSCIEPRR